jgi:hypothetical protein
MERTRISPTYPRIFLSTLHSIPGAVPARGRPQSAVDQITRWQHWLPALPSGADLDLSASVGREVPQAADCRVSEAYQTVQTCR